MRGETRASGSLVERTSQHRTGGGSDAPAPRTHRETPLDLLADGEGYLLCSRDVVGVTPWLAEAARWCLDDGHRFVLVTPPETTLTRAALTYLEGVGARWAVDGGDGLFDGHIGMRLHPDETGTLVMAPQIHDAYTGRKNDVTTAIVQAERVHSYQNIRVGEFVPAAASAGRGDDLVIDALGLMEPLEEVYEPDLLKRIGAQVSPEAAEVYVAGVSTSGTVEIIPQPPGVIERVSLATPFEPHWGDAEGLEAWCSAMAAAGASYAFLGRRTTATPTTIAPRPSPIATPLTAVIAPQRYPGLELGSLGALVDRATGHADTVHILFSPDRDEALAQFMRLVEHLAPFDILSPPEQARRRGSGAHLS